MIKQRYERDDGWTIDIEHDGTTVHKMDHLPMINGEPPNPLTLEYALRAMRAHGYELKPDNMEEWDDEGPTHRCPTCKGVEDPRVLEKNGGYCSRSCAFGCRCGGQQDHPYSQWCG